MILFNGFFDYKDNLVDYHSQMFSLIHYIYMVLILFILICLLIAFKNTKHTTIDKYLKILSIYILLQEAIKIIWESHYDIKYHNSFNFEGLLPLYLCSLFMFTLPFVAFGKGKVKEYCLSFITSVGIIGGLSNVFYLNILNVYPMFSFPTFVSIIYHFFMTFTGLLLLVSKYYIPNKSTPIKSLIIIIIFSIIVIPVNYYLQSKGFNPDYMLLMHGYGLPGATIVSNFLIKHNMQFLFTFFIYFLYLIAGYIVTAIYYLIINLIKKIKTT